MSDEKIIDSTETVEDNKPSIDELLAEIAQAKAEREKLKNALSKSNSDAAELKRALRAKQTEEEKEADAKREAEEARLAELKEKDEKIAMYEYRDMYRGMGIDGESLESIVEAKLRGDEMQVNTFIAEHYKSQYEAKLQAEKESWLSGRPNVNTGVGQQTTKALTREQIMSISDRQERQKLIGENMHLF